MNVIRAFGLKIHPLSINEFISIIQIGISRRNKIIQNGINAASINEIVNNEELKEAYNDSDLINIDGMSVVWALRFLGFNIPERVACPDLADGILEMAVKNNFKVFLLGAKEESIRLCVNNLYRSYPDLILVGFRNGYYTNDDEDMIVNMINDSQTDILFLGMLSPQKEIFVSKYREHLNVKYILGVGGYFDILAGLTKRAPIWMQNTGMEWFYRFLQEPKRMWRRYLIGNFKFIWLVHKEKIKQRKIKAV